MTCKLRRWIFNKRHEHLLPTFLLRYEVYTYGKLTSRWTQRPYLNFLRKLRKFWFDHNMATTLDLPLPLNILEDFSSQQLKTSTSFHLKKILQVSTLQLWKKREDFGATFTHRKMDMSFVLRISSSIRTDFENIWFPHQHLNIEKKEESSNQPITFEDFAISWEWAG